MNHTDDRKNLQQELNFKSLITEVALNYINLPLDQVDRGIDSALERMARLVEADRAYVFDFDDITGRCTNTHEWCHDGVTPEIDHLQDIPLAPDWIVLFRQAEPVYIPDIRELPDGEARSVLEPQGIKSLIAVPIMDQEICVGFVGFDSVRNYHTYNSTEREILLLFTEMLKNIRLRRLQEQEMLQAKNRAEESDRLKSAFLANMSHEIRTPMNGILGFAELLKDPGLTGEEIDKYLSIIESSGQRMLRLINDLIDIARIESGLVMTNQQAVSVHRHLSYLYEFFRPDAEKKNLRLIYEPDEQHTDLIMHTDREKLEAVLTNLLKNALRFTPAGSIVFGYRYEDSTVRFFVKDSGVGISKEWLQGIFNRFVRYDQVSGQQGSGLGLSISKAYVGMLGGHIGVDSEPGKGSHFYFTLPVSN